MEQPRCVPRLDSLSVSFLGAATAASKLGCICTSRGTTIFGLHTMAVRGVSADSSSRGIAEAQPGRDGFLFMYIARTTRAEPASPRRGTTFEKMRDFPKKKTPLRFGERVVVPAARQPRLSGRLWVSLRLRPRACFCGASASSAFFLVDNFFHLLTFVIMVVYTHVCVRLLVAGRHTASWYAGS